ncbi:MAG TPA: DinB family protein [Candidatus Limnocylindria bacterium]|nr:DinB family protein [Candidatus Limnocylindria bacterium]
MTLVVVDEPPDRPEWIRETVRLRSEDLRSRRRRLLELVARASDADLVAGSDEAWGIGQIAVHLLLVDRGVLGISLRLAAGEDPGATGQPRPSAGAVSRDGILSLADKAAAALRRFEGAFPAAPAVERTARHPFYGPLNCFGWLLTLANHYEAHLQAIERGGASAL